jgi:hypothetical protein
VPLSVLLSSLYPDRLLFGSVDAAHEIGKLTPPLIVAGIVIVAGVVGAMFGTPVNVSVIDGAAKDGCAAAANGVVIVTPAGGAFVAAFSPAEPPSDTPVYG